VIRWQIDNLVVRRDPAGNLKPDKDKSSAKIDGIIALLMALDRAARHQRASAYADHGLLVV
jgi:phage terminase large subunit-like protein